MEEFKICTLIERDGKLTNVSEEIQKKLFELGYKWKHCGTNIDFTEYPFLYTDIDGFISFNKIDSINFFSKNEKDLMSYENLMKIVKEDKEYKFQPFEKVLVRNNIKSDWKPQFFSHLDKKRIFKYNMIGGKYYEYCIPYKGNEDKIL